MTRIFAYGVTHEQAQKLKQLTDDYGFELIQWNEKDLPHNVGDLLMDKTETSPAEALHLEAAFLLFEDLPRDRANAFLDDLKEKVDYFPYKANVTATNKTWRLYDLIEHNMEEHQVMTLYGNLMKVSSVAKMILEEEDDPKLEEALKAAEDYFQPQDFEFEALRTVYNNLAIETNRAMKARLEKEK